MTAELLQIIFLVMVVLLISWWAERPTKRHHQENCDICARRTK